MMEWDDDCMVRRKEVYWEPASSAFFFFSEFVFLEADLARPLVFYNATQKASSVYRWETARRSVFMLQIFIYYNICNKKDLFGNSTLHWENYDQASSR